jgi:hypothetical protein
VVQAACCAQSLVFSEVLDAQLRKGCRNGVDEGLENGLVVVADYEDLLDLGDFCDSSEAMFDYWVAGDGE